MFSKILTPHPALAPFVKCYMAVKVDEKGITSSPVSCKVLPMLVFSYRSTANMAFRLLWKLREFNTPIPLLTNMDLGQMACKYYKRRFKIETMFKQLKSAGFQLHKSMLDQPQRIQNLIIILALTFIFTFGVGMLLKECANDVISSICRADRVHKMGPITLAKKAFAHVSDLAYYLFSIFSKNFNTFFT